MQSILLVLVALHQDKKDLFGHVFPDSGLVLADDFEDNDKIDKGLFGYLWGETSCTYCLKPENFLWAVLSVPDQDVIVIDPATKATKFRQGCVEFIGPLFSASEYLQKKNTNICQEKVAGAIIKKSFETVISEGFASEINISHGIGIISGQSSRLITQEFEDIAVALNSNCHVDTKGDHSFAVSVRDHCSVTCSGDESFIVALGNEAKCVNAGVNGVTIITGVNGQGKVGKNGVLVMTYWDGERIRVLAGYSGESIEEGKLYEIQSGKWVEITEKN